ncbi:hypothetical protein ACVIHI_008959 [Bradyrhizobium sp. USDA 4524]|uniref:hypothetical protein n=1 Tax=unclassified Bradyrhizobium TaxID=2631580 RepID=UPI00209E57B0|nr:MULTISPECIES: hypothetical protein [unclassified Bradyrhizobium]MCP1845574.1 hypothetical protein [Bradyrhizobium sp. USDA 4538]MCP1907104.1 hypothetical protein [Bradyrhizobium sp. USDA 4537]MCP1985579.1 hypothetical protein [Bradyrhizobium sp. USDA 4539]
MKHESFQALSDDGVRNPAHPVQNCWHLAPVVAALRVSRVETRSIRRMARHAGHHHVMPFRRSWMA